MHDKILRPQLVPTPLWGRSLSRGTIPGWPKYRWDMIRKSVYAEYDHRCNYCGEQSASTVRRAADGSNPGGLVGNEVWSYEVWGAESISCAIQVLDDIEAVCRSCDAIIHYGFPVR